MKPTEEIVAPFPCRAGYEKSREALHETDEITTQGRYLSKGAKQ